MFEIAWSGILILGVVALIFVGPKDMPVFLRTIGRYASLIKRQIGDIRAQIDLAVKEADLEQTQQDLKKVQMSVDAEIVESRTAFDDAVRAASGKRPVPHPSDDGPAPPLLAAPHPEH